MPSREPHPAIIRTVAPGLSSRERWALIGWACFALFLVAAMVGGAILFISSMGRPASKPIAQRPTGGGVDTNRSASANLVAPNPAGADPVFFQWSLNNTSFTAAPADPAIPPRVEILTVPEFPGYSAIWGATGRDHRGHVWFGVSTRVGSSAHLIEYVPDTGQLFDRGSVVAELKRLGLHQPGVTQIKIHSRIEQAPDGFLYFTSMDEKGEKEDGSQLPVNGSHLWRVKPEQPEKWEHLAAAPHGLIALGCGGKFVYMLGYYDHVLYQYDTAAGTMRSKMVGSLGGHTSRNLIVDRRGHAYVPRILSDLSDPNAPPVAVLVEFNAAMKEIAATPIDGYVGNDINQSHGIIALHPLADDSIVFNTHAGVLHRIAPPLDGDGPALVEKLGNFHPQGPRYIATLFSHDGQRHLMGVVQRGSDWDWVTFDITTKTSRIAPLAIQYPDQRKLHKHLLYGSVTRDKTGAFFAVGTDQNLDRPVVLRLVPAQ